MRAEAHGEMLRRTTTTTAPEAIRRPVLLCPACFGVSQHLEMSRCPSCDVELLARVPVDAGGPRCAPALAPLGVSSPTSAAA